MGYIAEPQDVDLVIAGGKLTAEDRKLLRALMAKQKSAKTVERVRAGVPTRNAKHARKSSRTKAKA